MGRGSLTGPDNGPGPVPEQTREDAPRRRFCVWGMMVLAAACAKAQSTPLLGQAATAAVGTTALVTHHFDWPWSDVGLLRYNRADALYVGARAARRMRSLSLEARLGWSVLDASPRVEAGVRHRGHRAQVGSRLFRRTAAVVPEVDPLSTFNALPALLAGRDEGEYYLATGAELFAASAHGTRWEAAVYFERQEPVGSGTDWTVLGAVWDSLQGRPLMPVEPLTQFGLRVTGERSWGAAPFDPQFTLGARGRLEEGGRRFSSLGVQGTLWAPLGDRVRVRLEANGHVSGGTPPLQRLALLGGPSRTRGFPGATASGPDATWGRLDAFFRLPGPALLGIPQLTLVVFGDLGWVGDRSSRQGSNTLGSVGTGVALLDRSIRAHAVKKVRGGAGWRFELYLDPFR